MVEEEEIVVEEVDQEAMGQFLFIFFLNFIGPDLCDTGSNRFI